MKIIAVVLLCLLFSPVDVLACRVMPVQYQIAAEETDLKLEMTMTEELIATADQIFLATATKIDKSNRNANFELIEVLTGSSEPVFKAGWDGSKVTIGCRASHGFKNILLEEGQNYLLYLKDGQILRASQNEPGRWGMSFIHELLIVRSQLSPNK